METTPLISRSSAKSCGAISFIILMLLILSSIVAFVFIYHQAPVGLSQFTCTCSDGNKFSISIYATAFMTNTSTRKTAQCYCSSKGVSPTVFFSADIGGYKRHKRSLEYDDAPIVTAVPVDDVVTEAVSHRNSRSLPGSAHRVDLHRNDQKRFPVRHSRRKTYRGEATAKSAGFMQGEWVEDSDFKPEHRTIRRVKSKPVQRVAPITLSPEDAGTYVYTEMEEVTEQVVQTCGLCDILKSVNSINSRSCPECKCPASQTHACPDCRCPEPAALKCPDCKCATHTCPDCVCPANKCPRPRCPTPVCPTPICGTDSTVAASSVTAASPSSTPVEREKEDDSSVEPPTDLTPLTEVTETPNNGTTEKQCPGKTGKFSKKFDTCCGCVTSHFTCDGKSAGDKPDFIESNANSAFDSDPRGMFPTTERNAGSRCISQPCKVKGSAKSSSPPCSKLTGERKKWRDSKACVARRKKFGACDKHKAPPGESDDDDDGELPTDDETTPMPHQAPPAPHIQSHPQQQQQYPLRYPDYMRFNPMYG